ncbi:MAG: DUF2207 domain-containing protein [Bacteroidaceae bacterium]|nr:DUF2207 domain-containing protein [Bacteroidaceae bacterium]
MKRFLLFLFTLVVSFTTVHASKEYYDSGCVIEKLEYFAKVHADNTWDVSEIIHVDFKKPRHGIFQYIEQKYDVEFGGKERDYFASATNIKVKSHKYKTTYLQNDRFTVIRIGDSDKEIEGKVVYSIQYTLNFPDDGFNGGDLLYTSVLGAMCENYIKEFYYNITFDEPLPTAFADSIRVYSGKYSKKNSLNVSCNVVTQNNISGMATNITHHNSITLYANLPEGHWKGASHPVVLKMKWLGDWLMSSLLSIPTLLIILVCILFVVVFVKLLMNRGEGKKPIPVIEYCAPDGISSAEVGYIIDLSVDVEDLTSLIIWWASKGYLNIEEVAPEEGKDKKKKKKDDNQEIILHKIKDLPEDAPEYQKKFWKVFFDKKDSIAISKIGKKYKQIDSAKTALKHKYKEEKSLQEFNGTLLCYLFGFLLLAVFAILVCCWSQESYELLFTWIGVVVLGAMQNLITSDSKYFDSLKKKLVNYSILFGYFCASLIVVLLVIDDGSPRCPNFVLYGITLMSWILILLSPNLQRDTPYRIELMSRLLGFREFINTAEVPMLKAMVNENPNYFYDVLPYAIVFGLSDKWCKRFKEIDFEPPTWYNAGYALAAAGIIMAGGVVADRLTDRFDKVISSHVQTSSISPSSRSGRRGGGGYSGGGGGGGGIGSW